MLFSSIQVSFYLVRSANDMAYVLVKQGIDGVVPLEALI